MMILKWQTSLPDDPCSEILKNTVNVTRFFNSQKAISNSQVMSEKEAHLPLFISLLLKHLQFYVGFDAIQCAVEISFC